MRRSFAVLLVLGMLQSVGCWDDAGTEIDPADPPSLSLELGPDRVALERSTVRVEPDGAGLDDDVFWEWTQIDGPSVALSGIDVPEATFRAPETASPIVRRFRLTATDAAGAVAVDELAITTVPDPIDEAPVRRLTVGGVSRLYKVWVPESHEFGNRVYLLLHGGGQSMVRVLLPDATTRRWVEIADRDGALLLVPNGWNVQAGSGATNAQSWNDLRTDTTGRTSTQDDVTFLRAVLADAAQLVPHDPARVFVAGASNGGIMAMRLLVEASDVVAGGAAFIAALPAEAVPAPGASRAVFLSNGTRDPLVRPKGGPVGEAGAPTRSVADTVEWWREASGADPATRTVERLPDAVPDDGCALEITRWRDGPDGSARLTYVEAVGGGHTIPDPDPPAFDAATLELLGGQCREAHGVDLAVEFFDAVESVP